MRYEIRPLGAWTDPLTENRRSATAFRASWGDTLALLGRETQQLDADLVVVQIDVTDGELRRDGMLRSRARVDFPGVRVSFGSRHGPLTYATDAYESRWHDGLSSWQANVRAIALALEALRAVDRWGVTRRGEQYRGWTALPAGTGAVMTVEAAARFIAEHAGWVDPDDPDAPDAVVADLLGDHQVALRAYRAAAMRLHPDRGGDAELFRALQAARERLDAEHSRGAAS